MVLCGCWLVVLLLLAAVGCVGWRLRCVEGVFQGRVSPSPPSSLRLQHDVAGQLRNGSQNVVGCRCPASGCGALCSPGSLLDALRWAICPRGLRTGTPAWVVTGLEGDFSASAAGRVVARVHMGSMVAGLVWCCVTRVWLDVVGGAGYCACRRVPGPTALLPHPSPLRTPSPHQLGFRTGRDPAPTHTSA